MTRPLGPLQITLMRLRVELNSIVVSTSHTCGTPHTCSVTLSSERPQKTTPSERAALTRHASSGDAAWYTISRVCWSTSGMTSWQTARKTSTNSTSSLFCCLHHWKSLMRGS